jgi:hypothetical protein
MALSPPDQALLMRLAPTLYPLLGERDGAAKLVQELPRTYSPADVSTPQPALGGPQRVWELCGVYFLIERRFNDALPIFERLYLHMLDWQDQAGDRCHKGMPLVWIAECHLGLSHPAICRRFLMLTLCEDAIRDNGTIPADQSGIYFRLVWREGISDKRVQEYARLAFNIWKKDTKECRYPEWVLQGLGFEWQHVNPSTEETTVYSANPRYIDFLVKRLGERTGKILERLSQYIFSVIPGMICNTRAQTPSTDYDIVCSQYGQMIDFRSEIGRYFIGECKDWKKVVGTSAFAKFSHVIDTVKCKFGVIFSRSGISGVGKATNAEREQIKTFQNRGVVIIVVSESDLTQLAVGDNFITMLRRKYEKVRLDLRKELL